MKRITVLCAIMCIATCLISSIAFGSANETFNKSAHAKSIQAADLLRRNVTPDVAAHKISKGSVERPNAPDAGHRKRPSLIVNAPKAVDAKDVFRAIENDHGQAVKDIMIDHVIDPDSKNEQGFYLLEAAIIHDNPDIVKTLLRFGASPVDVAENANQKNSAAIAKMLQEYKALRTQLRDKSKK